MKRWLLFFALVISFSLKSQTILYVDGSVSSSGTGGSWASAFQTLNEALNVANAGSSSTKYEIQIAGGTYYPTGLQSDTTRDSTFFIGRAGIRLLGNYPPGGGTRFPNSYLTTLSGNIGSASTDQDNSRHVLVIAGISGVDTVLLDGIYVNEGNASVNALPKFYNGVSVAANIGGGIVIKKVSATVLLNQCSFFNNRAAQHGGAVYNEASATVFTNSNFYNSRAGASGGGIFIQADSNLAPAMLNNCYFSGNLANFGGCVYNIRTAANGAGTQIFNCRFGYPYYLNMSNTAYSGGGALADVATRCQPAEIRNSFFYMNTAFYGAGVFDSLTDVPAAAANNIKSSSFSSNQATGFGGGIAISGSNSRYSMDSVGFYSNYGGSRGGGMYNKVIGAGSLVKVSNCQFSQDSALSGGGTFNAGCARFTNNRFYGNSAVNGGGMFNYRADSIVYLNANQFQGNFAGGSGGGLFNSSAFADTISNCLFSGNKAISSGGGMTDSSAYPVIIHCTFANDTAAAGNALRNDNSSPIIHNSILWDGVATMLNVNGSIPAISYSTVQGGYPGVGNLSSDPLFYTSVRSTIAPTTGGDYSVIPCSPAIDAGKNSGSYSGLKDLAGNARLYGAAVDQGAYEYAGGAFPPILGQALTCGIGTTLNYRHVYTGGSWSVSNPAIATINSNGLLTTHSVGVDTIFFTAVNGTCSSISAKVLTVYPSPISGPIQGPDSACAGTLATFQILADSTTITTQTWSSFDRSIADLWLLYSTFMCYKPGMVSILCTVTNIVGCQERDTFNLTVLPAPAVGPIPGNSIFCLHDTVTFYDTTSGGIWKSSDPLIATVDSSTGFVRTIDTGTVVIRYSVTNNLGCVTTVSKSILVDQVYASVTQNGNSLIASDSGTAYQWIDCRNGQAIPGEIAQIFVPNGNGQYAVIISRGSCSDTSMCVSVSELGVTKGLAESDIQVYPNPASDRIRIRTTGFVADRIALLDLFGRRLKEFVPDHLDVDMSIQKIPAGYYWVEVCAGARVFRRALVVLR
jgi:hypothetical protein